MAEYAKTLNNLLQSYSTPITIRNLFGSLTLDVEPRRSYRVVLPNKIKKGV